MMKPRQNKIDFNTAHLDLERLPHSADTERTVLGTILYYPDSFNQVYKYLKPKGLFYDEQNAMVWAEMCKMAAAKTVPSHTNVLRAVEAWEGRNMGAYVKDLATASVPPIHLLGNCLKLNEYWIARTIHRMGHYLNQQALKKDGDYLELLGVASDSLAKIYSHIAGMREKTLNESTIELSNEIVSIAQSGGGVVGVRSSLNGLNRVIKGYRNGNLIIIAASTGEGKTTLAVQEILHTAEQGIPVGYISLEMKTSELLLMMACSKTAIPVEAVLDGTMTPDQTQRLSQMLSYLKTLPIHISDTPGLRTGEVKALARMWHKQGIKMLVVDHMHLMRTDVDIPNPEARFTEIANQLKELAKELDIPILDLAQLSRKEDKKDKRVHIITDLKYASGIEQAADVVLLIFRPEVHEIETDANGESTKGFARIIVGKLRLLPKRDVKCHFTGMSFIDLEAYQFAQSRPEKPAAGITNFREKVPEDFWNQPS